MAKTVLPNISAVFTKLGAFLVDIVPTGVQVVRGDDNRVAMPSGPYVCMTEIYQGRLSTNEDSYDDSGLPADSTKIFQQSTQLHIQLDFYGPEAAQWCVAASTLFRDESGCISLAPDCQPLYIDDGRQIALVTGEEQYLKRWTSTAVLQWNPVISTPQQFADTLTVDIISVETEYPPT